MVELKFMDNQDIKIISQIIGVYEHRMLSNGQYIPQTMKRAINHFKLSMTEIKEFKRID